MLNIDREGAAGSDSRAEVRSGGAQRSSPLLAMVANVAANTGIWGIGGDRCVYTSQQLTDPMYRFPEFESLSLSANSQASLIGGDIRTSPQDCQREVSRDFQSMHSNAVSFHSA